MNYIAKNFKESKTGLIDDDCFYLINNKTINLNSEGYARIGNKKLHQIILEIKLNRKIKKGLVVDHINRNRLDNRKINLREVSIRINSINKTPSIKYNRNHCGCTFLKSRNKWQSQIKINGKQTYLGIFNSEKEASDCYYKKLKEMNL